MLKKQEDIQGEGIRENQRIITVVCHYGEDLNTEKGEVLNKSV